MEISILARLGIPDFPDFPKSVRLQEAVTFRLLVGFRCPDTLDLSPNSNSFESGLYGFRAPCYAVPIADRKIDFSENALSPPQLWEGSLSILRRPVGAPAWPGNYERATS